MGIIIIQLWKDKQIIFFNLLQMWKHSSFDQRVIICMEYNFRICITFGNVWVKILSPSPSPTQSANLGGVVGDVKIISLSDNISHQFLSR